MQVIDESVKTEQNREGTTTPELPKDKRVATTEEEMISHLFESTVLFFRLLNTSAIKLGWSRSKRKQLFESIVRRASVDNADIIQGLVSELKPLLEEISEKTKNVGHPTQSI